MRLAVLFALLSGCGWDYRESLDPTPRPGQWAAVGDARDDVQEAFGYDTGFDVGIYWSTETCPYDRTRTAVVTGGSCYHGLTISCDSIFVADRGDVKNSALRHELFHCFHGRMYGDYDAYHENKSWWELEGTGREQCESDMQE